MHFFQCCGHVTADEEVRSQTGRFVSMCVCVFCACAYVCIYVFYSSPQNRKPNNAAYFHGENKVLQVSVMCRNGLILWDAKVAECCVPKKENEAGRTARMLIHICSQTHTLTALKRIHKNYAADNVFIQIYHSICQLHNMFIKRGTRVLTACSLWYAYCCYLNFSGC